MNYKPLPKENCDGSFKIEYTRVLCYTKLRLETVSPNPDIVGEVILKKHSENVQAESTLTLAGRKFPVTELGSVNRLVYRTKGYIAVGENAYIRIFESRIPFLISLSSVIIAALIAVLLILLLPKEETPAPPPLDNPLPLIDPNAVPDPESKNQDKPPQNIPQGGGSVNITFKPTANLDLNTGKIKMSFTNPITSSHAAVIEMFVIYTDKEGQKKELQIATSGLIPAGKKLETMTLDPNLAGIFSGEGSYNAKYRLQYYDPNTGIQSIVDAEFNDVVLRVQRK